MLAPFFSSKRQYTANTRMFELFNVVYVKGRQRPISHSLNTIETKPKIIEFGYSDSEDNPPK